jgi:hypothetical protein
LETFFERDTFSVVDQSLIPLVENHLKALQTENFTFLRGPDGYSRIKRLALAEAERRKEKKREEYFKRQDPGYSPLESLDLNDDLEYFTQVPQRSRKNSDKSLTCITTAKDDSIFEMEMEEIKISSTPTKSKSWRKVSLTESGPSSHRSSPSMSPWLSSNVQEKYSKFCLIF